jgi:hypothetical protein
VILAEDLQAQVFVAKLLGSLGVEPRQIRRLPLPAGKGGAGEQFVREHYPAEVASFRRRSAAKALIVHIDADPGYTVAQRHAQLAEALKQDLQAPRRADEGLIELVPKRNIETWLVCLGGQAVDEEQEYPKVMKGREASCAPHAARFADSIRSKQVLMPSSDSLEDGLAEMQRVF